MGWILLAAGALLAAALLLTGMMIRRRKAVGRAFAALDAHLKKRYDLILILVEACRGCAAHERGLLDELTGLRARALRAPAPEVMRINAAISARIRPALAIAPLKASEQFDFLERSLSEVEGQIAGALYAYNDAVVEFNNRCRMFPTSLAAGALGLSALSPVADP